MRSYQATTAATVPVRAVAVAGLCGLLMSGAILAYAPGTNLMLAAGCGANVALLLIAVHSLYQWRLLLSPIAGIVIGPGLIASYSFGNLAALLEGETRYMANTDSLSYYPEVAMLTAFGLLFFVSLVCGPLRRPFCRIVVDYKNLRWDWWQVLAAAFLSIMVLAYLSNKYDFINGYFRNVQGDFDRWLAAAHYMFVALTALISVSVFAHADRHAHRLVATAGMVFPLVVAIGLRYRTFMATIILMMTACWLTLRPEKWKRGLFLMAVTGVLLFVLGSTVKVASVRGSTASILANLTVLQTATIDDLLYATNDAAQGDRQYRLAGFEMPAAILRCLHNGTEPSYGTGFYHGVISALPAFLRPEGDVSERETIYQRFSGCGLVYGDSIGVPLTSGLADWGIWLSPVVYAFLAFYCLAVWRVAQLSNRFYLAMLMTTAGLGDLLWDLAWDDGLLMIRGIVFAWLVLFVTGPLLMPRSKENARELFGRLPPRANRPVPAIAHGRP